jgi:hypothetical protein
MSPLKIMHIVRGIKMKTVYQMCREGWCDDCIGNPDECRKKGKCKGYEKEEEDEDTD